MKPRSLFFVAFMAALLLGTFPRATAAANASSHQPDPVIGPHARQDAQHRADKLQFTPATSTPAPRQAQASSAGPRGPLQAGPAAPVPNEGLRREVFGFAPYWALSGTSPAYTGWNYSLVSTVAYFGLTFDTNGNFQSDGGMSGWNSAQFTDMVTRAHAAGDRVVLVVKAFDNGTICSVSFGGLQTAITNTITAVQSKHLDGVNVDFEGNNITCGNGQSLQSGVTGFMRQLSSQMHAAIQGSYVSIDTYSGAASWSDGEFKIDDLASVVDAMFVMAYDMDVANMGGHAGPTAPLNGGYTYTDTLSVQQYLGKAPAGKIILGVPYYGVKFSTSGSQPYAPESDRTPVSYANVLGDLSCTGVTPQWDSNGSVSWFAWLSPAANDPCGANRNTWREEYYDNAESLGLKYDLVNNANIRGAGVWSLDQQGSGPDLWNEISLKFVSHWENLGGLLGSGPDASLWGATGLDVYIRGAADNALWHTFNDGSGWHWESLGGGISADPAAVSSAPGHTDVFVRGADSALWHRAYAGTWGPWERLGGVLNSGPDVVSPSAGVLNVFVRGMNNGLWELTYGAGGTSTWQYLGGVVTAKPSVIAVNGHTELFVRGYNADLWHRTFDGTNWGAWEYLGGAMQDGPAASTWGPTRIDVFARGVDNRLWHRWFDGTSWSGWSASIGGGARLNGGPAAISPSSGKIDLFVRGLDNVLWHLHVAIS